MIFVTIGTMYGFPRLIKEMDSIAENIKEEIVMQIGETVYEPKNARYFRFAPRTDMEQLYINSRIVVCHAGVGSILSAIKYNKPVIVIPRRKEYGEVIDDHQLEITKELENDKIIKAVYDVIELMKILIEPTNSSSINIKKKNILAAKLKDYLNQLNKMKYR